MMFFRHVAASGEVQEEHLKKKLCALHNQLLDFNRRITPTKKVTPADLPSMRKHFQSPIHCVSVAIRTILGLLGYMMWIAWPMCFPLAVYLAEGDTFFFWQVAAVALFVVLIIVIKMASELYGGIKYFSVWVTNVVRQCWWSLQKLVASCSRSHEDKASWLKDSSLNARLTLGSAVVFSVTFLLMLGYKETIACHHLICVGVSATCFLTGACFSHFAREERIFLPLQHMPSVRPGHFDVPHQNPSFLSVPDLTGFCHFDSKHTKRSPPPTYQEAIQDSAQISGHPPACRSSLFQ